MHAVKRLSYLPGLRSQASLPKLRFATMASPSVRKRHTFAPLGQQPRNEEEMEIKGIVFDMDGTLCTSTTHPSLSTTSTS